MDDTESRAPGSVHHRPLPPCERCGQVQATTSLTFTYRDEPYATHFYCAPCCDVMWDEGKREVDIRAAKLKEIGL